MRRVFADTLYWVAITHRKDQWHLAAVRVSRTITGCHLITTDEVLTEVLNAFCEAGPMLRQRAAMLVSKLQSKSTVTVHCSPARPSLAGLALYDARPDKQYSLTDCISMEAKRQEGVNEILTNDNHFKQEGFTILL